MIGQCEGSESPRGMLEYDGLVGGLWIS